ncbi:hypothetical protein Glove_86g155 [Diversispora epigaea]|uniref:Uncharacterized protein n=1 Tax=Diversispora epigaea TaxID=1348612 RepID=A0A397JFP5_9GLOM|nr:hypothetical protein Glove_86g155 [Diversispora epigaea]
MTSLTSININLSIQGHNVLDSGIIRIFVKKYRTTIGIEYKFNGPVSYHANRKISKTVKIYYSNSLENIQLENGYKNYSENIQLKMKKIPFLQKYFARRCHVIHEKDASISNLESAWNCYIPLLFSTVTIIISEINTIIDRESLGSEMEKVNYIVNELKFFQKSIGSPEPNAI